MSVSIGPWDPQYPVNFYESGDTVTQAFGKHIQEIERIYGLLNALDADKVSGAELAEILRSYVTLTYLNARLGDYVTNATFNSHVNSGDPHPNLQLSTLRGSLGFDRITGNLGFDRVTGNIPANRINGLNEAIDARLPSGGGGLTIETGTGYVQFSNGFMMQWGSVSATGNDSSGGTGTADFAKPFSRLAFVLVSSRSGAPFSYSYTGTSVTVSVDTNTHANCNYFALGMA